MADLFPRSLVGLAVGVDSPSVNRLQRLIQQRVDERGLTLNAVAERGGINRQTLYHLMRKPVFKQMPAEKTLRALEKGLELPYQLLKDAAAESMGVRVYDEPVDDQDTKVVIAAMQSLPAGRRKALRQMAEALLNEMRSQ